MGDNSRKRPAFYKEYLFDNSTVPVPVKRKINVTRPLPNENDGGKSEKNESLNKDGSIDTEMNDSCSDQEDAVVDSASNESRDEEDSEDESRDEEDSEDESRDEEDSEDESRDEEDSVNESRDEEDSNNESPDEEYSDNISVSSSQGISAVQVAERGDNDDDNSDTDVSDVDDEIERTTPYSVAELKRILFSMALKMKHDFDHEETENVRKVVDLFSNTKDFKTSKYHFKKILNEYSVKVEIHHICPCCEKYVGEICDEECENDDEMEVGADDENRIHDLFFRCKNCTQKFPVKTNLANRNFFMYIPVTGQLVEILQNNEMNLFCTRTKLNEDALEDIYDGRLYQEKVKEGMISVSTNIDGAPVFERSGTEMLPMIGTLNNLKVKERRKNAMMISVYVGKKKIDVQEYLKPFVREAKDLYNIGLNYMHEGEMRNVKVVILCCICDSIARPLVRNTTQFNGEWGCGLCLHRGKIVEKGLGHTNIYLLDENDNPFGEGLRDNDTHRDHAENGQYGVKGKAALADVPEFDIIRGLPAESMHNIDLGIGKTYAGLWFDSVHHDRPFYIGLAIKRIDARLKAIKPSLDFNSTPRAMSEKKWWKAHDWRDWILYYSLPVLEGILDRRRLNHWALFVQATFLLSQTSISLSEVETARQLILQFVKEVPDLYGEEFVICNTHLINHAPDGVLDLGPLWTHSAYLYEDCNHEFLKFVHSSQGVAQHMADNFRLRYAFQRIHSELENELSEEEKKVLSEILGKKNRVKISSEITQSLYTIGKGVDFPLQQIPRDLVLALSRINVSFKSYVSAEKYLRILHKDEVIHSKGYVKPVKRRSYYVLTDNREVFAIDFFLVLTKNVEEKECFAFGKYYTKNCDQSVLRKYKELKGFIPLKEMQNSLGAVNARHIKEKVAILKEYRAEGEVTLVCILPNRKELMT